MLRGIALAALCGAPTLSSAEVFSDADLCKAAIAVEMGREVGAMHADRTSGGFPKIWYVRSNDGQKFIYRCRIEGNRIIWSTYFTDSRQWGRWRNNYSEGDAETIYSVVDNNLKIENSQLGERRFTKSDF